VNPHGYGIPFFIDKIYRDFQVKGLLRAAGGRFALLRKPYRALPYADNCLGAPGCRETPSTLAIPDRGA
jgi:hypothetical protein